MKQIKIGTPLGSVILAFLLGSMPHVSAMEPVTSTYPALAFRFQDEKREFPDTVVSIVNVPQKDESLFLGKLITSAQNKNTDPLFVIYQSGERVADLLQLDRLPRDSARLVPFGIDSHNERFGQTHSARGRSVAGEISLRDLDRAGTLVGITVTGLYSFLFYCTAEVAPATAASLLVAALQAQARANPRFYLGYLTGSGNLARSVVQRFLPDNERVLKPAQEAGKVSGALLYSFVTSSGFKLALNLGDIAGTFGSLAAFLDTASTATFGVFSSNVWDLYVERNTSHIGKIESDWSEENVRQLKVGRTFIYSKQLILASISPFMFFSATHDHATYVLATIGVIGLGANLAGKPFWHAAEYVLNRMEDSQRASDVFAKMLNAQNRTVGLFKAAKATLFNCKSALTRGAESVDSSSEEQRKKTQ